MIEILGQTDGMITPNGVAIIIGALAAFGGVLLGRGTKSVKLAAGSEVEMKEKFVTRREFEKLEATMAVNATKMEQLFERTMDAISAQNTTLTKRIENQNDRLSKKIEENGSANYQGRQKLWVKVNEKAEEHGERIAALEKDQNVAAAIMRLAEATQPCAQTKVQPTHTTNP